MTVAPLALAPPRPFPLALPRTLLVVLAWSGLSLLLRAVSVNGFLVCATLGLTAATLSPFLRRVKTGFDAGDVFPFFVLYYTMSILLRGFSLMTGYDSAYLRELGDVRTEHWRLLLAWTNFYSALGLMAAEYGYESNVARRWAEGIARRLPSLMAPWRTNRLVPTYIALTALGLLGATLRARSLGGFMGGALNPMAAGTDEALGHWWQIALTEFAVIGFHVHMIGLALRRDRRFLLHYLVLGLGFCGPIYLMSSSKSILLRTLFLPWLYYHFAWRPIPVWRLLAGFALFAALLPFFYAYRFLGLLDYGAVGTYIGNIDAPLMLVFNRAYGTDSFMLILHRTGVTLPFQWGKSLIDIFVYWIPRVFWDNKPMSFGLVFPSLYMPDMHWGTLTYASASLPGELYLDFHLPGILLGSFALGAGLRACYALARRGPGAMLLYGYVFITGTHMVEGCIATQLEVFSTQLLPSLLAVALLTRGAGPPATAKESP
jgi:hypothetical protein